ncbi:DUF397 domain-containing protein [Nocardia niwae]|uniref:DUF397 domain-containing protein n=1 Tax=Nocardia niwae TaxID=626084 RepID=UPI0007A40852|nr:DUF397 domain-containing protein [Nocardia niwae]
MSADLSRAKWFKSSHSSGSQECVEVAWLDGGSVGVRDSKNPAGPALVFNPSTWDKFATHLNGGEVNHPA